MNHIVIIGFMGSGKTRAGKSLSQELGLPFVDVDKAITIKMGLSVKEIFDRFGEPFYRALETFMLKDLCADKEKKVISLGAGLPVQEQNKDLIPELGTVIYIKGSAATLKKRLDGNGNPLVEGEEGDEKLKRVLKQRDPIYAGFADITVVTGEKPFEELIREILSKLAAMNGRVKISAEERALAIESEALRESQKESGKEGKKESKKEPKKASKKETDNKESENKKAKKESGAGSKKEPEKKSSKLSSKSSGKEASDLKEAEIKPEISGAVKTRTVKKKEKSV